MIRNWLRLLWVRSSFSLERRSNAFIVMQYQDVCQLRQNVEFEGCSQVFCFLLLQWLVKQDLFRFTFIQNSFRYWRWWWGIFRRIQLLFSRVDHIILLKIRFSQLVSSSWSWSSFDSMSNVMEVSWSSSTRDMTWQSKSSFETTVVHL